MPQRKRYHKVRGGCFTCKERKVRCGLERPRCQNCCRLSQSCTYATPAPENATRASPYKCETCGSSAHAEVQLIHHYSTYTFLTLSRNPVLTALWKEIVPKHAFRHQFLLQGLFALAAHHRLQDPAEDQSVLIDAANFHHQEALSSYISLLSNITEENCTALFAFSQVIVAVSYSRLNLNLDPTSKHGLVIEVVKIFELLKGVLVVAEKSIDWLRAGDLAPMLGERPRMQLQQPFVTDNAYVKGLLTFSAHISNQPTHNVESKSRLESLLSTIDLLNAGFLGEPDSVDRQNLIIGLPVFFDSNYLGLLRSYEDASLVVLAYYGVLVHQMRHVWCFGNAGAKMVEAATHLVGTEWAPYTNALQREMRA